MTANPACFDLVLDSTHELGLDLWGFTRLCVLPSTDGVVILGKSSASGLQGYHVYSNSDPNKPRNNSNHSNRHNNSPGNHDNRTRSVQESQVEDISKQITKTTKTSWKYWRRTHFLPPLCTHDGVDLAAAKITWAADSGREGGGKAAQGCEIVARPGDWAGSDRCEGGGNAAHGCDASPDEWMVVSCASCNATRVCDVRTSRHVTVLETFQPGNMCNGAPGVLYLVNELPFNQAILTVNTDGFDWTFDFDKTIKTGLAGCYDICYIPTNRCVVVSYWVENVVRALSVDTGEVTWEVKGTVGNSAFHPQGVLYVPRRDVTSHDVLLVCNLTGFVALNPRDGALLRSISLPGLYTHNIYLLGDRVVARCRDDRNQFVVAYLSIQ